MKQLRRAALLMICLFATAVAVHAQEADSLQTAPPAPIAATIADSVFKKVTPHAPRKATIRSAIVPGWGQAYNKKYWKIPLVYGALGTCVGFFIYNRNEYIDARDAYRLKMDGNPANDFLIKPKFRQVDPEAIRRYRNEVRQNVDYSVLFFLVCWGLNVVDATVDAYLKSFDVSENLSLRIKPAYLPATGQASLSFVFNIGNKK